MSHLSKNHKRFVKIFLFIFCTLLFLFVVINIAIDPFAIYQFPTIAKFNEVKVSLIKHERLYKAVELARKKPKAILLGSSRIFAGFDPHDIEAITGIETYNAALTGCNFEEIYHYFEHALYHQPDLKVVIVGLDFFGFSQNQKVRPGFKLERLKRFPITWEDLTTTLLTRDALKCSFETFKANLYENPIPNVLSNGQQNPEAAASPKNEILAMGQVPYLKNVKKFYQNWQLDEEKIELFQKLVDQCKNRSIELKFFFSPKSAIYWEVIYRSYLWSSFENLKRKLCAIYPIWDFSGFNCVTTGTLEQEIHQPLYFECSHYRPIVGKWMAEKMFNPLNRSIHFGVYLTPETIEHALEQMSVQANQWLLTHEDIMKQIEKIKD